MVTASYYKKYGIVCCIVLKLYYLCDVIEETGFNIT